MKVHDRCAIVVCSVLGMASAASADGGCTAAVRDGTLLVTCDDAANVIRVSETAPGSGNYEVDGNQTTINGRESVIVSGVSAGIEILLGGGDDEAVLRDSNVTGPVWVSGGGDGGGGGGLTTFVLRDSGVGGGVTIVNGDGGSDIRIRTALVEGDVTVTNGAGLDAVKLEDGSVIAGSLVIDNGPGDPDIGQGSVTDLDTDCTVEGDVTIINGEGFDDFRQEDSIIGGTLAIANGHGGSSTEIVSDAPEVIVSTVGGDALIVNGDGADLLHVEDAAVMGTLFSLAGDGDIVVEFDTVAFGGEVILSGGSGFDDIFMRQIETAGAIEIGCDDGGSDVLIRSGSLVGSDLIVTAGVGPDHVKVEDSTVTGGLQVQFGDGGSLTEIEGSTVGADAGVIGEAGLDILDVNDALVAGTLTFLGGEGDSAMHVEDECTVGGDLVVECGQGIDQVELDGDVLGGVSVRLGGGGSQFELEGAVVGAGVFLECGEGFDDVLVRGADIGGWMAIRLGNGGSDTLVENATSVGSWLYLAAMEGSDSARLTGLQMPQYARVFLGRSDDVLDASGLVATGIYADGGLGSDSFLGATDGFEPRVVLLSFEVFQSFD